MNNIVQLGCLFSKVAKMFCQFSVYNCRYFLPCRAPARIQKDNLDSSWEPLFSSSSFVLEDRHGKKTRWFWAVYQLYILADFWKKSFLKSLRKTVDCCTFLSIFSVLFYTKSPMSIIFECPEQVFVWNCAYCPKVLVDDHRRWFFLLWRWNLPRFSRPGTNPYMGK